MKFIIGFITWVIIGNLFGLSLSYTLDIKFTKSRMLASSIVGPLLLPGVVIGVVVYILNSGESNCLANCDAN